MRYISRVDRVLLRDRALAEIREAIVDGTLPPGEPIKDVELAERLGLSRTPVREAIARLTDEGLVESKPHSYTRVTPLDVDAARDAQVVVRAMHGLAARLAVPRATEADVEAMRAANAEFAAALAAGDVAAAHRADEAFHRVAVTVSGNAAVAATIERYTPALRRLVLLRFSSVLGRESVRMHEEIVAAFVARDAERAGHLVERNWETLGALLADSAHDQAHDSAHDQAHDSAHDQRES
ncbi:DNA-binding transcriptional regulator, GntR family [Streptoalloteichus tenebrarius]|uniref:DNA-binding transcriptional regulator, GntR family n=1 Tax=Streptoalloteichus tenebrarius (strain ATCC 17920 / DSM 40477 / JCM 4838 / CBS 697.72 / NBRC 16177 / NCIMB 11028 / NRRL B-12390 / A12253. 1 / ISP 5477) TaxID=1933 RepID=A0ABT1HMN0_STRSD|nr:GntR family transcriptional regulator [Streptoalloteichus tenebrarius]MCP2256748.1 DNA-binding transcriptional regulator, GntR family [Streptoalloteichus tenebrarius]BFF00349.1 GntR family transcriptional regulator [Streptoalloteichus tenebrarius]